MENKTNMNQIVFYDLSFNSEFSNILAETGFNKLDKDYNTVAIIGAQSSGKSTLLNELFETNFEVMNDEVGRGQTTKGIWIASCINKKILLLDCEGTDSKERGDERLKFEYCSSLFALALADLLIINLWTSDVGRYTASNYGTLKIVFEMNLKLFQQECAKKIMIVLRDFDEQYDSKERITNMILTDINNLWSEIKKPEKYKDYSPNMLFEFEFITIAHKFYKKDLFIENVAVLKRRLERNDKDYLFKFQSEEKNVPSDCYAQYCENIWRDIINNKDLNIPGQKEMLANFKCNEVRNNALTEVDLEIQWFISESNTKIYDSTEFGSKCDNIKNKALTYYDQNAKNYLKYVFDEIRRHLIIDLSQRINICFANQIKKLIPTFQRNMRNELEKEIKRIDNFFKCAIEIKKKYLSDLLRKLKTLRVFESWEINSREYEELFDDIIDSVRKLALSDKKTEIVKKLKRILDDEFITQLEDISPNFWIRFNQDYIEIVNGMINSFQNFLSENFKMDDNEIHEFSREIQEEIYVTMKKDIKKKIDRLYDNAISNFKKEFFYEEGIPRIWNKIEESQIDNLFSLTREKHLQTFNILSKLTLAKYPNEYINKTFNINEIDNEELISEQDIKFMIKRYEDGINEILDDAKRRHANIIKQSVPLFVWILIIYLGYSDVIKLAKSYWIIPVILLFSAYGTLHAVGMGHIPKSIISVVKNMILPMLKK